MISGISVRHLDDQISSIVICEEAVKVMKERSEIVGVIVGRYVGDEFLKM